MNWSFTPESKDNQIAAPWFEDARANIAPYYSVKTTLKQAQALATAEFGKLNAIVTAFQPGKFAVNGRDRYGYIIEFIMNNAPGRMTVAGLPMKSYKAVKENRVRIQCLLNVRDWLKAAVTMQVFSPDTSPLIPYLLVKGADGQDYTLADLVMSRGQLPMLASQSVTVERE